MAEMCKSGNRHSRRLPKCGINGPSLDIAEKNGYLGDTTGAEEVQLTEL